MGNCAKLKWNRKRLGLTQEEFAKKAGVAIGTISRLEHDETAWLTVRNETEDKIYALFDSMDSWQPSDFKAGTVIQEIHTEIENQKDIMKVTQEEVVVQRESENSQLNKHDQKTFTLIEFAYEGLKESETHEDFAANIKMLKRILDKY